MSKVIDLKGSILSLTILNIYSDDIQQVKLEINEKVEQAPSFFSGIPVVIEPKVSLVDPTFLALLVEFLYQLQMIPIGVRSEDPGIQDQAEYAGLALFPPQEHKARHKTVPEELKEDMPSEIGALVIKHNVRSGQQVYAKGRDLIVLGSINPGAEVVADGHVHVFGKARGKIFAGAAGYADAKIFASHLNPEMVCIAGMYQLSEDIDDKAKEGFVEVALKDNKLVFNSKILG